MVLLECLIAVPVLLAFAAFMGACSLVDLLLDNR